MSEVHVGEAAREHAAQGVAAGSRDDPVGGDDALRHAELAAFLRARRRILQPEDVGLSRSSGRRVSGLRREEVAMLASVSMTWYTWLEQARNIHTTPQVLDSLARALRLDDVSHRYLRRLGGHPVASSRSDDVWSEAAQRSLWALVDEQMPSPALLIRPNGDLGKWNAAVSKLWFDPNTIPQERRNGLMMLTSDMLRDTLVGWEDHCRNVIAGFRAEAGKRLGDPRNAQLVDMLSESSGVFRDTWAQHQVKRMEGERYVHQSKVGEITTEQVALRPIGSPTHILLVHRLADEISRSRMLELLAD
jgi:hypothetical protein